MAGGINIRLRGLRGLEAAARELDALGASGRRAARRFLRDAQKIAVAGFVEQVESSGRAFGLPFPPLAPRTLKARRGRARKPLVGRGKILRALLASGHVGARKLVLLLGARARDGRSLLQLHERGGRFLPVRRIRHPRTGLAGRALRRLDERWRRVVDRALRRAA